MPHEWIETTFELSGLIGVVCANYDTADKGLLFSFVERWHPDTNCFHLPIRELTIILDDVSNLLLLPIVVKLYMYPTLDEIGATELLVVVLRVDRIATTLKCNVESIKEKLLSLGVHLSQVTYSLERRCISYNRALTIINEKYK